MAELGRVVEAECRSLQYEAVQQGHHHPGAPIGIELGWNAPGGLAMAKSLGDALPSQITKRYTGYPRFLWAKTVAG